MSTASEPVGTLEVALAHAARLLKSQPALASEQASEILKAVPAHPPARLILGVARRLQGEWAAALEVLEPLAREQPRWSAAQLELGIALGDAGRGSEAIAALRRATDLQSDLPDAWRLLADHLDASGDAAAADQARARFIKSANRDPRLMAAAAALVENRIPEAEALLRQHLRQHETDVAALRMLAEVAARLRRYPDAELLLSRCLELAPSFDAARHNYAVVLFRQTKADAALPEIERLLAREPRNPGYRNLKAAILAHLGDYSESIEVYESVLREYPDQPKVWLSYGHALKTARRHDDSVAAYRHGIRLQPSLGEAYWSLANLKTFRFSEADVAAIRAALAREDLAAEDRLHFEFALGKALEDREEYGEAFARYAAGSALRLELAPYDPDETSAYVRRCKALYTREFFAARAGAGSTAPDPIFIVGMPRAGSTLLEQILASHPLVEGTMELPDISRMARDLAAERPRDDGRRYPAVVAELDAGQLRALGEQFLAQTRVQRKTAAPYFIDKMPNNWLQVALIHLILPNSKIIDARRHPLGCCFSNFKQHYARGQSFSYSLQGVGRYYRDYVEWMAHVDAVLPGRVHRVHYERMIDDTEPEVRRLLAYCGLPFDERCLRFYENDRAVRTASSEQVRRPIYREGMDHWKHFEPWLGPLKAALGPVLERYPEVPDFAESVDTNDNLIQSQ
ncbi:MAG TPA: sulfotransferase [Steroidobacteraceae bacterium]|nr:sulfotransferase [Steroidobacteraceae bacterium]